MDAYNEFTGLRQDGRRPNEMRLIEARISVIQGSTGSAEIRMGQTQVLAQVFGPMDAKVHNDIAEVTSAVVFADFAKVPHSAETTNARRSRESEIIITRTFENAIIRELYPNSRIHIDVTVIQDDGGYLAAAINAASLALIDAGIPMQDFVVSLSTAWIADMAFLDTGRIESSNRFPVLDLAVFPNMQQVVSMNMTSRIGAEPAKQLVELAMDGCVRLHKLLANCVRVSSQAHGVQEP